MPLSAELIISNFSANSSQVFFKHERLYKHRLLQVNYTTYDVQRDQDTVNPGTSHCNIMLLSKMDQNHLTNSSKPHHFLYAHVLGIYHVNAIYIGPGMVDYNPQHLDFLWVRWYQHSSQELPRNPPGWNLSGHMDEVYFPPMSNQDAFGFVDPADVLRSCHIIPRFAKGRRYLDGIGLSKCAKDSLDWNYYYVSG